MKTLLFLQIIITICAKSLAQNWESVEFPTPSTTQYTHGACLTSNNEIISLERINNTSEFHLVKYAVNFSQSASFSLPAGLDFPYYTFNHITSNSSSIFLTGQLNANGMIYNIDYNLAQFVTLAQISSPQGSVFMKGITVVGNELYVVGLLTAQWPNTNATFQFDANSSLSITQNTCFVANYSLATNSFQWVRPVHGTHTSTEDVAVDKNGFIYITGKFKNSITLYNGLNPYTYNNTSEHNFLVRLNNLGEFDNTWGLKQLTTLGNEYNSFDVKVGHSNVFFIGSERINGHSIYGSGALTWEKHLMINSQTLPFRVFQIALDDCDKIYVSGRNPNQPSTKAICGSPFFIASFDRTSNAAENWISKTNDSQSTISALMIGSDQKLYSVGNYGNSYSTACPQVLTIDSTYVSTHNFGVFLSKIDDVDYSILPNNFLGEDLNLCLTDTVLLSPQLNGQVYQWFKLPDLTTVISNQQAFSPIQSGTYRVELTNLQQNCKRFDEINVLFENCDSCIIEPAMQLEIGNCQINYSPIGTSGTSDIVGYHWDFGDNSISTREGGSHIYTQAGNYTVTLTIFGKTKNGDCCSRVISKNIKVNCDPSLCEIEDNIGWNTTNITRRKLKFTTYVNFLNGTQALTYLWSFGDGAISTDINPVHLFPYNGTYTVTLKVFATSVDGQCCEKSFEKKIRIRTSLFDIFIRKPRLKPI